MIDGVPKRLLCLFVQLAVAFAIAGWAMCLINWVPNAFDEWIRGDYVTLTLGVEGKDESDNYIQSKVILRFHHDYIYHEGQGDEEKIEVWVGNVRPSHLVAAAANQWIVELKDKNGSHLDNRGYGYRKTDGRINVYIPTATQ